MVRKLGWAGEDTLYAILMTLFHPLLNREGSLIDFALGRSAAPKWLLNMRAVGTVQVDALDAVGADLSRVRAGVSWE